MQGQAGLAGCQCFCCGCSMWHSKVCVCPLHSHPPRHSLQRSETSLAVHDSVTNINEAQAGDLTAERAHQDSSFHAPFMIPAGPSPLTMSVCVWLSRSPVRSYSMHGPAGALLSIGLLRLIDWAGIEQCVLSEYGTGELCPGA